MKILFQSLAVSLAFIVPVASFAQSNVPVTRAQVRAELVELENAGYRVGQGDQKDYPEAIQAAEAKVAAQHQAAAGGAYGGGEAGSSGAGQSNDVRASSYSAPIYSHH